MRKKVVFTTKEEQAAALKDNAGLRLIEEARNKYEGYFLFTDEPGSEGAQAKSLEERVVDLEARIAALEKKPV